MSEKYVIQTICTANACRSRIAQGVLKDLAEKAGLESLMEVRSSGMKVDKIKRWGIDEYLSIDAIFRVLNAAYNNGIHLMTQYRHFVEEAVAEEDLIREKHDNDDLFRDKLNTAASNIYKILAQFDKASTILVMAEHGLVYPGGEPMQFREDGSDLYIPMEEKFVEMVQGQVHNPQSVRCFDEFIPGMEMKSSLAAVRYKDGKLDIAGFRKIYDQIELGCRNLMHAVENELK